MKRDILVHIRTERVHTFSTAKKILNSTNLLIAQL